jgi:hypothetical protein
MSDIETVGEEQVHKYFRVENALHSRNEGKILVFLHYLQVKRAEIYSSNAKNIQRL